jgi:hypothetical protein
MSDLVIDRYEVIGGGRDLLTEGYLRRVIQRDKFCRGLVDHFNIPIVNLKIIYVCQNDPKVLASRRNRSPADYLELIEEFEIGSKDFVFETFRPDPNLSLDECSMTLFDMHISGNQENSD